MNVCGAPTSFVAFGAIAIFAFTHVFVAGPEFAPVPFGVARQRDTADRHRRVRADRRHAGDRRAQVDRAGARPPAVVHGFADVNAPGPLSIVKLICVPFGALTKPLPSPALIFTCAVNVCV